MSEYIDVDVRPILRAGGEPFSVIMAALERLEPGQGLRLYATFKPVPLFAVMADKGFAYSAQALDAGEWEVLFTPTATQKPASLSGTPAFDDWPEPAVKLDNRDLDPPEPMVRILAAAERRNLPPGLAIVGLHLRQTLNDKFFSNFVRAFDLLTKLSPKGSLAELRRDAHSANRFQLVGSAFRLNILGDDFVNGLGASGKRKKSDGRRHKKEKTEDVCELPKRSPPQFCLHELTPPGLHTTLNGRNRNGQSLLLGRN